MTTRNDRQRLAFVRCQLTELHEKVKKSDDDDSITSVYWPAFVYENPSEFLAERESSMSASTAIRLAKILSTQSKCKPGWLAVLLGPAAEQFIVQGQGGVKNDDDDDDDDARLNFVLGLAKSIPMTCQPEIFRGNNELYFDFHRGLDQAENALYASDGDAGTSEAAQERNNWLQQAEAVIQPQKITSKTKNEHKPVLRSPHTPPSGRKDKETRAAVSFADRKPAAKTSPKPSHLAPPKLKIDRSEKEPKKKKKIKTRRKTLNETQDSFIVQEDMSDDGAYTDGSDIDDDDDDDDDEGAGDMVNTEGTEAMFQIQQDEESSHDSSVLFSQKSKGKQVELEGRTSPSETKISGSTGSNRLRKVPIPELVVGPVERRKSDKVLAARTKPSLDRGKSKGRKGKGPFVVDASTNRAPWISNAIPYNFRPYPLYQKIGVTVRGSDDYYLPQSNPPSAPGSRVFSSTEIRKYFCEHGIPGYIAPGPLSPDEADMLHLWISRANIPKASPAELASTPLMEDAVAVRLLARLKFELLSGGRWHFPAGSPLRNRNPKPLRSLEHVRFWLRGAPDLTQLLPVNEATFGSGRPKRLNRSSGGCKLPIKDRTILALRLWASVSKEPLPVFGKKSRFEVEESEEADDESSKQHRYFSKKSPKKRAASASKVPGKKRRKTNEEDAVDDDKPKPDRPDGNPKKPDDDNGDDKREDGKASQGRNAMSLVSDDGHSNGTDATLAEGAKPSTIFISKNGHAEPSPLPETMESSRDDGFDHDGHDEQPNRRLFQSSDASVGFLTQPPC